MSCEYVSKAEIFRNQGLEPLIRCLSNSDPDVQKNSLETITQLLLVSYLCLISFEDLQANWISVKLNQKNDVLFRKFCDY